MSAASRARTVAGELLLAALLTAVISIGLRLVVQGFRVEGASMMPALQDGQSLLVNKTAYSHVDGTLLEGRVPGTRHGSVEYPFGGPRRGDVAVFRARDGRSRSLVKRVIGLPGDRVVIKGGDVIVNGRQLDEPYVRFPSPDAPAYPKNGRPLRVPDGSYFVLGDNRADSADSRLGWFVPVENLVGRAWLSYWPPARWGLAPHHAVRERPDAGEAGPRPVPAIATVAPSANATVPRDPQPVGDALFPATPWPDSAPAASFRTVLDERFADNQRTWPNDPQSTAWFADGAYRLLARQPGRFVTVGAPIAEALRDVVVTGTFRKVGGPPGGGFGLIVRDQGGGPRDGIAQEGQFYVLEVGDRGELGIWRRDGDRWIELLPWTTTEAVRPDAEANELTVRAIGPRLTFVVNGVEVASLDDSALREGGVGVFLGGDFNEGLLERLVVQVP